MAAPQPASELAFTAPSIELPKGGGAIRGMGEKFAANAVMGTGSMSVPIATSPGRGGFGPQLALSYDSGSGNGPFGFGWQLTIAAITRKTEKGLPQYRDLEESDVFMLAGAEDLVPQLRKDSTGKWLLDPNGDPELHEDIVDGYRVRRYRPRTEGIFARIERWTLEADPRDVHWRSLSKDNALTVYGADAHSRIFDPTDAARIFSWLICESRDDKGNGILYRYKTEDGTGADTSRASERNRGARDDPIRTANRYLKRIHYGNRAPLLDAEGQRPRFLDATQIALQIANAGWMFEVVFDYGEHDADMPTPRDSGDWHYRGDAFSTYRAGFEVRTTRLCRRVLMFHHFLDAPGVGRDCLVRSTDFSYSDDQEPGDVTAPIYAFLRAATAYGYRRRDLGYDKRGLPPVEFEYTRPEVHGAVVDVDAESLENLPVGVHGAAGQWTDLHGEGIRGILTEQGGAWFYKRNVSPIAAHPVAFAPQERVATKPNLAIEGGSAQFMDLAGDGQPDLVVMDGPMPGLFAHDDAEGWHAFRPFTSRLNRDLRDPNVRFVDLDGDGRADVLITEDDALVWHASQGESGFGAARRALPPHDEEKGPRLVFDDGTESVYLADMSGDGLTDLVRIRNGETCYWPNLGYGRFGAKVTMDDAPWFDAPDLFEQRRIRLADIDGSGTTDIIYLHGSGPRIYFNQSGNGWSVPRPLAAFPAVDDLAAIEVTDLFGNGTACLAWSSPAPGDARRPMRYVDLMGGQKPHLLVSIVNNLGCETRVHYASSVKFYLQDRRDGKPWITKLPFPVHVVERVESLDYVGRNRFVTRYAYHHGYFDREDREFRGFGMVEQWDTEHLAALVGSDTLPQPENIALASHIPPVLTKTWYHTGVYLGREHVSDFFAGFLDTDDRGEYFREPGLTAAQARDLLLADTVLPPGLTFAEAREACRALKGSMLRQEIYALDGSAKERLPYSVTSQAFAIRAVQPIARNRHGVFFVHAREALNFEYERNPADPRVKHALTLEVDEFGSVQKSAAVSYGRRTTIRSIDTQGQTQEVPNPGLDALSMADRAQQTRVLATYVETQVTNAIDTATSYRTPLPCDVQSFELTDYTATGPAGRFRASDFVEPDPAAPGRSRHVFQNEVAYEDTPTGANARRAIDHGRTLYRKDDFTGLLPLGQLGSAGLQGESYRLAFTPGLLAQVYRRSPTSLALLPDPVSVLGGEGGYLRSQSLKAEGLFPGGDDDDQWWAASGRSYFTVNESDDAATELAAARQHFYLARRYRNAFGHDTSVDFDAADLLIRETRDALGNRVTAQVNDYRLLRPALVSDPNGNRAAVAFDILGEVAGTAVMGKPAPAPEEGDSLDGFTTDLTQAQIDALFDAPDPATLAPDLLQGATTRIVYDPHRFRRTQQPAWSATLSRETHAADPLPPQGLRVQLGFSYRDGFGREIQKKMRAEAGALVSGGPAIEVRWVGSGWTIYNNKGKPVRSYEPFFSATHGFEFGVKVGVSPAFFYDPAQRVVATLQPDNTYAKVVFDAWQQTTYDANDTAAPRNAQTGDPRTDPDIAGYVSAYFEAQAVDSAQPWQTWHARRIDDAFGADEKDAATKAAAHADTPTTVHFDALGRPFLTVARNRVVCAGHALDGSENAFASRVELDVEGNRRAVRDAIAQSDDAQGRVVMRYAYDMLGNRLHQASMDAGARWMLHAVDGKSLRAWDDRGHDFSSDYDALRRPVRQFVRGTSADSDPHTQGIDVVSERIDYGEEQTDDTVLNLRTRVFRHFDGAGVTTTTYDFKGNTRHTTRQLAADYRGAPDWSAAPILDPAIHATATTFDALNRTITTTMPDDSVVHTTYDRAGLPTQVHAQIGGATGLTTFVSAIDYDAKGRRRRVDNGNGTTTHCDYDPLTSRLRRCWTLRGAEALQDLSYIFDPVGNITRTRDDAQQDIYFRNRRVEPSCTYCYDALYRLIEASGREHLGQAASPAQPSYNDAAQSRLPHPGDGNVMGLYLQQYVYDAVGNFIEMGHRGSDPLNPGWTRTYAYAEASPLEPGKMSNRLSSITAGGNQPVVESYAHDIHGNVIRMAHLAILAWNFRDQLSLTQRQQIDAADSEGIARHGERTFYSYDAAGNRMRKVTELASGAIKDQRVYIGGLEIYRRSGVQAVARNTLHIMDGTRRAAIVETRTEGDDGSPAQVIRYQFGNHVGSACLELDEGAQIISYEEFTPYGSTSFQAVRGGMETNPKRYRYTGKERDEESGFTYHGARYYAAWIGRWTAPDPAFLIDGPNIYLYAQASPVVRSDPSGMGPPGPDFDYRMGNMTDDEAKAFRKSEEARKESEWMEREVRLHPPLRTRLERLITDLTRSGMPTGYMSAALGNISVYKLDDDAEETAAYQPAAKAIHIRPTALDWYRGDGKPASVGEGAIFHEMYHAYVHTVDDPGLSAAIKAGQAEYKSRFPKLSSSRQEELLDEDAAKYIGLKTAAYWRAYGVLEIASKAGTLDLATYDRARENYNTDVKGVQAQGYYYKWWGLPLIGSVVDIPAKNRADPSLPAALKSYIDDKLLEGRMPDDFDAAPGLTAFHSKAVAKELAKAAEVVQPVVREWLLYPLNILGVPTK